MTTFPLTLRVAAVASPAQHVRLFTLVNESTATLPAFSAGSHIELALAEGLSRSYSLLNDPAQHTFYQIAVHLSPDSTGGSRYLHEQVDEGMLIHTSAPRNLFPLHMQASHSCLIAGGIGITPLIAMTHELTRQGRSWELHYCARTPAHAAFVPELQALADKTGNGLHCYFDGVPGGESLNIKSLVAGHDPGTHFYCCGPNSMLRAFEEASAGCSERAHMEYFSAKSDAATSGGFEVELARSGRVLQVPPGKSILDVVTTAGVNVLTSCREGICGSCETRIIQGVADHRDAVLTTQEQEENTSMMICCSGSKSARLVLDL